jgi:nucleoid DNA-binding protein
VKLENYISELLYQYDCVVVPGLGGFVANYKSAKIQAVQNTFLPPSKSISFNKNLTTNDGLLANLIAQKEGVTFDVSIQKIESAVASINQDLKQKKTVLLHHIGTLFLDAENRTQFEPQQTINYLLGSYGLAVFQKQPIQRATIEEKITKEFVDRTAPLTMKAEKSKQWMYSAALAILTFGVGWMASSSDLSGNLNAANLNPFSNEAKQLYTPSNAKKTTENLEEKTIKQQVSSASKNAYYLDLNLVDLESPLIVQLQNNSFTEADNTAVSSNKKRLNYHVIAGCFSDKANAKLMAKDLKRKGFEAFIVGKRKGLWAVSYNSFSSRKEAVSALNTAQKHNDKAWILNQ